MVLPSYGVAYLAQMDEADMVTYYFVTWLF